MKKMKRARRRRIKARPGLLASAAPSGAVEIQEKVQEEISADLPISPPAASAPDSEPDSDISHGESEVAEPAEAAQPSSDSLEAALAERERIGYLRGRAEAVEAVWVDTVNPSRESLAALARMGIPVNDPNLSPFAGRKSVWDS